MIAIEKADLLGHLSPETHPAFVQLNSASTDDGIYFLRAEAAEAWMKMHALAKHQGLDLRVVSATRNFDRQKQIWENKWTGRTLTQGQNLSALGLNDEEKSLRILKFSAMPGTSRHHWGSDMDINSVEEAYFETEDGISVYNWLQKNAAQFGFFQPYTAKGVLRENGYEEEKWHWSFAPLSVPFLTAYQAQISYSDINGFEGSTAAQSIQVIEKYVCGISASPFSLPI
jgi:LAS superfamily LD-carboxypeptidase LdcB